MSTLQIPTLTEGLVWSIDRHLNPIVAQRLCSIKILRPHPFKILGITFKYHDTVAYSVTYDDDKWIQDEMDRLLKEIS